MYIYIYIYICIYIYIYIYNGLFFCLDPGALNYAMRTCPEHNAGFTMV